MRGRSIRTTSSRPSRNRSARLNQRGADKLRQAADLLAQQRILKDGQEELGVAA
jgi:hypothetical protein